MAVNQTPKFQLKGSSNVAVTQTGAGGSQQVNVDALETTVDGKVERSGDTMIGALVLAGDPSAALGAATKQYADLKLAKTGGTMTGALFVDGSADAIQGKFQGHSTQTSPVIQIESSTAAAQIKLQNDGGAVFNENGNGSTADFRVETDNDANALFVDASADTVQVGAATASDSAKFYVNGKLSTSGEVEINGDFNHDGANAGAYGVPPVARPSAITQTYSTTDKTHAARTASTLTDNIGGTTGTTLAAIPNPADLPLTADALRDDLVANILPVIRNILSSLALQHNNSKADSDDTAQVVNAAIDDLQSEGWLQ